MREAVLSDVHIRVGQDRVDTEELRSQLTGQPMVNFTDHVSGCSPRGNAFAMMIQLLCRSEKVSCILNRGACTQPVSMAWKLQPVSTSWPKMSRQVQH